VPNCARLGRGDAPSQHERLGFRDGKLHRNLLDYLDVESFQRGYSSWVIRQEADSFQIQIGKDLGSQAYLAMDLALAFRKRW
jgi:hypothetical protein